ncbi:MAG: hypothetical protein Rpha_2122 [Candidatus Ruthia sp. Apha_13_S6]|nr:hypothetical protein [Candidatus Ruthia sp. Apha_13_S6]
MLFGLCLSVWSFFHWRASGFKVSGGYNAGQIDDGLFFFLYGLFEKNI